MLLQKFFPYLVVELLVDIFVVDDVDFAYVLLDIEGALGVERLVIHSLVVRSCCSKALFSISLLLTLLNNFPSSSLLSLLFCSSFASHGEFVALLDDIDPFLCCQVLLFKPLLSFFCANFVDKNIPLLIVVVVAVGSRVA